MANALIPNQNILNRRGYSDEGIDLSLYQVDPGLQEYLNYLAAPQTREVMGNALADTIPASAQGRAIERLRQQANERMRANPVNQTPFDGAPEALAVGVYESPGQLAGLFDWMVENSTIGDIRQIFAPTDTRLQPMVDDWMNSKAVEDAYNAEEYTSAPGMRQFARFAGNIAGDPLGAVPSTAIAGFGPLLSLMSRKGVPEGIARAPQAARMTGTIGSKADDLMVDAYHGYPGGPFKNFDTSKLGSTSGARDSKLGFYHSRGKPSAASYSGYDEGWTGEMVKDVLKGIDKSTDAGDKEMLRAFKALNPHAAVDDIIEGKLLYGSNWNGPFKMPAGGVRKDSINTINYKTVDWGRAPWDENRQAAVARDAMEEGYDGVIFKDMQDSGWFGGSGIDDIYLTFDPERTIAQSADSLPMDEASRMARAKEMGFDTSQTVYHGTPDARDIHKDGFSVLKGQQGREPGPVFFSNDRSTAASYADDSRAWDYQNAEPEVIEAFIRQESPLVINAKGATFRGLDPNEFIAGVADGPRKINMARDVERVAATTGGRLTTDDAVAIAKRYDYDGLVVRNVIDDHMAKGKPKDVFVVFDGSQARSPKATFDPAKKNSANLLAGGAAAALGLNYLAEPERKEYVTK